MSKYREFQLTFIGVVLADGAVYFTITIIPVTARYGYYVGDWRANFYAAFVLQFLSFVGLFFLYYPPAHPLGIPFVEAWKHLDYLGAFLFVAGSLPVLLGIIWVSVYPSSNPHVVAPLVIGFVLLTIFALYETFGKMKYPLTPPRIFTRARGRDFTAPCIALAIINMFYYSAR
jgi:Fungal trichothecene efflux pump (TRI12)